ncbi:glycosyltransferase [Spirosoma taeanense]|uniref:Glycosyltransferase n=1 Tax=Spirosoma taeanense TaxID=2735870 RepID=A0A6M5Y2J4_9BACT|nr:glycosyltransferase [Spirosoma taeanense]QJW88009.1 glycosyltransferase [Spirosoma taeanense]
MPLTALAPIVLFAYKRPHELQRTLQALQANHLAPYSQLYVFVDGPSQPTDVAKVEQVRQLVAGIEGFAGVVRVIREANLGCAASVIAGVSEVLARHDSVIVVEDDIVTAPNFLDFMNQALIQYAAQKNVYSIGGYTFPFRKPTDYKADGYFFGRHCAWGWGIWADRWQTIDWAVQDFHAFMNDAAQRRAFSQSGDDLVRMLRRTMEGELDAWDIRLCFHLFRQGATTLYPTVSKVENIGFYSADGTNTNVFNRYKTPLDAGRQRLFTLPEQIQENALFARQFRQRYSLPVRAWNRLKTYAGLR